MENWKEEEEEEEEEGKYLILFLSLIYYLIHSYIYILCLSLSHIILFLGGKSYLASENGGLDLPQKSIHAAVRSKLTSAHPLTAFHYVCQIHDSQLPLSSGQIRRCTIKCSVVPLLCGASRRNKVVIFSHEYIYIYIYIY